MKMDGSRWLPVVSGLALCAVGAGCGVRGAVPIHGTSVVRHITESGEIAVPADLSSTQVTAWVEDGAGGLSKFAGAGAADGTFFIDKVPEGFYLLELRKEGQSPTFVATSSRAPSMDSCQLGRADAVDAAPGATLIVNVTGLSPWKAEDDTVLFAPNAGAIAFSIHSKVAAGAPMPEDNAFTGMRVDYANVYPGGRNPHPRLIEGNKGDTAHLVQLVHGTKEAGEYFLAGRHCTPAPFTQVHGQSAELSCDLAEVVQDRTLSIQVDRASFEGHRAEVHPSAIVHETEIVARALPRAIDCGMYSGAPELFIFEANADGSPIDTSIHYGNPYPATWDVFVTYLTAYWIPVLAPGATKKIDLRGFLRNEVPLSAVNAGAVKPIITPPKELRINNKNAFAELSGVTISPTLSWKAPETGAPAYYEVSILHIYNEQGATKQSVAASIKTAETSVMIPPGVLESGHTYVVQVYASTGPSMPSGTAPVTSSLFKP